MNNDPGHLFSALDGWSLFPCETEMEGIWSEWFILDLKSSAVALMVLDFTGFPGAAGY